MVTFILGAGKTRGTGLRQWAVRRKAPSKTIESQSVFEKSRQNPKGKSVVVDTIQRVGDNRNRAKKPAKAGIMNKTSAYANDSGANTMRKVATVSTRKSALTPNAKDSTDDR